VAFSAPVVLMTKIIVFAYIFFLFIGSLVMALMMPLDGYIDYVVYNTCFIDGSFPAFEGSEPSMNLLCSVTANFSENIAIVLPRILSLGLLIAGTVFFSRKFNVYTGLFFIYLNGFQTLGAYRQGTSTILLCFALYFLLNGRITRYYIYAISALTFHFSSVFVLFVIWLRQHMRLWIAICSCVLIMLIEPILTSPVVGFLIPQGNISRYVNLTNHSLPGGGYFALGKVWYVIYYSYFIIISVKFFEKVKFTSSFNHQRSIFLSFLPIIVAVPALTLMDSWAATRVSSLTNAFELIFFALYATSIQRLFIFLAYFVRSSIAFINFFII
jgi:hypothetical protein